MDRVLGFATCNLRMHDPDGPQTEFFFLALLPPIMFEAGFSLQVKPFFRNIGAIVAMAFVGTCVSTALVGLIM